MQYVCSLRTILKIMCKICAVCAQSSRYVQNMRSLRTILKICAKYVQFAYIKKRKKMYSTGCWSPVQALGRPNVREPVLSMWYGLRYLQLFYVQFVHILHMCTLHVWYVERNICAAHILRLSIFVRAPRVKKL